MSNAEAREKKIADEAGRIVDFLVTNPVHGNTTTTRQVLREMLLKNEGCFIAAGHLWNIVAKHIGAGVYRVTAERKHPEVRPC